MATDKSMAMTAPIIPPTIVPLPEDSIALMTVGATEFDAGVGKVAVVNMSAEGHDSLLSSVIVSYYHNCTALL